MRPLGAGEQQLELDGFNGSSRVCEFPTVPFI